MSATAKTTKPNLDLRGWALCTWVGEEAGGVKVASLYGAKARQVGLMEQAGWVDRNDGVLTLNETGRKAIAEMKPESMPKLTTIQREFLEEVIDKKTLASDINYPPVIKLLSYGAIEASPQRFGGYKLVPTEMALEWDAARQAADEPSTPRP